MRILILSSRCTAEQRRALSDLRAFWEASGDTCEMLDWLSFLSDAVSEINTHSRKLVRRHIQELLTGAYASDAHEEEDSSGRGVRKLTELCARELARRVIAEIGYTERGRGFDAESCRVTVDLHTQSPDIARGVRKKGGKELLDHGAGDQGMMFGYACRQTETLMPFPIETTHALSRRLERVRTTKLLPYLLPDGKTQVTVEYEDEQPVRIAAVVVSAQHRAEVDIEQLRSDVITHVILPTLPIAMVDRNTEFFINPTGRFVEGGPAADSGLTGRKLIVDTYGGYARHGGGAFSGKDASKVDRSGAYMARYMAKNVVAAGLADRCEVQLSYAIGLSDPMSVRIDTFDSARVDEAIILSLLRAYTDPRPAAIIQKFNLTAPQFYRLACYGHFGSNAAELPWEQTDIARALQR